MSNWHVLERTGSKYRMVYHVAIPNVNNPAGFNYRTLLLTSKLGGTTILPDGDGTGGTIDPTEKTNIGNGSVYELITNIDVPNGLTGPQTITFINQDYTANSAVLLTDLQTKLTQYGRSG